MQFLTLPYRKHAGGARIFLALLFYEFPAPPEIVAQDFWEPTAWPSSRKVKSLLLDREKIVAGDDTGFVLFSAEDDKLWTPDSVSAPGSVSALAVNVQGHLFASISGSGIFHSVDGNSWIPRNNGLTRKDIRALAITTAGHLFAGDNGGGIFRSQNNGDSWVQVNEGLDDGFVAAFAVNKMSKIIFAGTTGPENSGVYRSKDDGGHWTLVNNKGLTNFEILSFAVNEKEKYILAGTRNGIFRSTNDGASWARIDNGFANTEINCLDLPSNRTGYIFAGTNGGGVYRSINNGRDWLQVNSGLTKSSILALRSNAGGRMFVGELGAGVLRSKDARLPSITHTPISLPRPGDNELSVEAQITDDTGIAGARLFYRQGGDSVFSATDLQPGIANNYSSSIPASVVKARGVEYYIFATDLFGNFIQSPLRGFFSVQVHVGGDGEVRRNERGNPVAQQNGSDQLTYRLFSVPLDLEQPNPEAILEDDLGPYNNKKWRFFEFDPDQKLQEFPKTANMRPGKAFWLIVKEAGKFIDTGPGLSNRTDKNYVIPLHPKWNYVGNPFNFSIPADSLRLKSRKRLELRTHSGGWNDQVGTPVSKIQPFEGYAIFVDSPDTLMINPDLTVSSHSLSAITNSSAVNQFLWSIRILARCQNARDVDNVAAIGSSVSKHWDEMDQPEPPVIGEYVSVYFPHRDWQTLAKTYCLDARPEPINGEVWAFEVKANIRDKVHLTFEGLKSAPSEYEIWLIDDVVPIAQNLRQNQSYVVAASSPEHPKRLKLVVGKCDFVEEKIADTQVIPTTYELNQNFPNPFNPATTIRYGLPKAERVTLKIYNLLGEEVALIMNDELRAAGYHVAIWDGRNKLGEVVGSGVYIYRFRAGSFTAIKKMALVK